MKLSNLYCAHLYKHVMVLLLLFSTFLCAFSQTSSFSGTIRGRVTDQYTQLPIEGVTVLLMSDDSTALTSVTSDKYGYYIIPEVKPGKQSVLFSYKGYRPYYVRNRTLMSSKQLEINAVMSEQIDRNLGGELEDIVLYSKSKHTPSKFSTVSTTALDIKTANQFAGSLFDIARMATNLPGVVVNSDSRNDIVIRGNSPSGLIWRLNDMDVPNPNHFGGLGVTGGPVSILNTSLIAHADFYTSAFPAEFGNGISGVFNLQMRAGNFNKREHEFQIGFNGFEIGSEGYFSKKSRSSYLFAARISLFQVFNYFGAFSSPTSFLPKYSDITAKVDVPLGEKGNHLSAYAIWGINQIDLLAHPFDDSNKEKFTGQDYYTDTYNTGGLYMAGISYKHYLSRSTFFKLILGATEQRFNTDLHAVRRDYNNNNKSILQLDSIQQRMTQNNLTAHLYLRAKLNKRNLLKVGVNAHIIKADFSTKLVYLSPPTLSGPNYSGEGTLLVKPYLTWRHLFNDKITLSAGVHSMYFQLSESFVFSPRTGLSYQLTPKHKVHIGYGRHAQMQPFISYFFKDRNDPSINNLNMDFTLSDQLVFSYTWQVGRSTKFKVEGYYQWLHGAAVDRIDSNFSMLNAGADFTIPVVVNLQNTGLGTNRGIELSLNRDIEKGFYYLLTASLFESTYTTSTGKRFPTAFDNRFVMNVLAGKEWSFKIRHIPLALGGSFRFVYAGGRPYTDVLPVNSSTPGVASYDIENTNAKRMRDYARVDLRIYARMNLSAKVAQEFSFEFINLTNKKNDWLPSYDAVNNRISISKQQGFRFVVFYKLYF